MSPTSSLCGDGLFNQMGSELFDLDFRALGLDPVAPSLYWSVGESALPPSSAFERCTRSGTDVFSSNARRDPVDLVSPAPSLTALVGSGSA
ncbi:hypothetical protein Bca101_071899 [Brassica carinata]